MRPRLFAILLVAVLLLGVAVVVLQSTKQVASSKDNLPPSNASQDELIAKVLDLQRREEAVAGERFGPELLAEECGRVFERLWDEINAATNKFAPLAVFPTQAWLLPDAGEGQRFPHSITRRISTGSERPLTPARWNELLAQAESDGWRLTQCELRQIGFSADASGRPQHSDHWFSAHLVNEVRNERMSIDGEAKVDWGEGKKVQRIIVPRYTIKNRAGDPFFQLAYDAPFAPPEKSFFIDPLILYDLDGDGASEIILASCNTILRCKSWDHFEREPLCKNPVGPIFTGMIADFDGDGAADFLCARFEGLYLFRGSAKGTFDEPGELVWRADPRLKYAQVLTCGDIDGDGDLDVWLGQYRVPYERGNMPAPWDNANDGNPSHLLLNDGRGSFTDATVAAGLEAKRFRRTYSGSFLDLNNDGHLDLAVVSDFAGLDLYLNDGHGHFKDVTRDLAAESRAFGMAHVWNDLNGDGWLDFLMIGMNSPVADRLASMGLSRTGSAAELAARSAVTYGNRLYLAADNGRWEQNEMSQSIARSGWSWGAGALDFDNDGFDDIYIANGHETKASVRDYETEFWMHDIFVGTSADDVIANAYFGSKLSRIRGGGDSYGGYEKNRLYLNQGGTNFTEAGHLAGVALELDSRNVVADDLDGDGRMDLLVTTFSIWPEQRQMLKIYRNVMTDAGHWIGVRLREQGKGLSPVGARIMVHRANGIMVKELITGDSYRSQHANTAHFGLGAGDKVDSVEVRWPNGRTTVVKNPAINQWLDVKYTP